MYTHKINKQCIYEELLMSEMFKDLLKICKCCWWHFELIVVMNVKYDKNPCCCTVGMHSS